MPVSGHGHMTSHGMLLLIGLWSLAPLSRHVGIQPTKPLQRWINKVTVTSCVTLVQKVRHVMNRV
jgi:hypothetical protein